MNKTQKTDKKRNNILISGKELFARRGFSETTIADITRKANTGKGTFYVYFENKDQLLFSIIEAGLFKLLFLLRGCISFHRDPITEIEKIVDIQLKFITQDKDLFTLFLNERNRFIIKSQKERESFKQLVRKELHEIIDLIAQTIKKGIKKGIFENVDIYEAAYILEGIIGNLGLYRLSAEKGKSVQELNATIKKIFLEGIIRKKEYKK